MYQPLHIIESAITNGTINWSTAPQRIRDAAAQAETAHALMLERQAALQDAEAENYVTIQNWKDTSAHAVSAGKPMPSKNDVDLAEVTVIARNNELNEASQDYRTKVGEVFNRCDPKEARDEGLDNINAECSKLAAVLLEDGQGSILAGQRYAGLVALSQWVGMYGTYMVPPSNEMSDLAATRSQLLNIKPWQKPTPAPVAIVETPALETKATAKTSPPTSVGTKTPATQTGLKATK